MKHTVLLIRENRYSFEKYGNTLVRKYGDPLDTEDRRRDRSAVTLSVQHYFAHHREAVPLWHQRRHSRNIVLLTDAGAPNSETFDHDQYEVKSATSSLRQTDRRVPRFHRPASSGRTLRPCTQDLRPLSRPSNCARVVKRYCCRRQPYFFWTCRKLYTGLVGHTPLYDSPSGTVREAALEVLRGSRYFNFEAPPDRKLTKLLGRILNVQSLHRVHEPGFRTTGWTPHPGELKAARAQAPKLRVSLQTPRCEVRYSAI
ncbi:hypothetical protein G7046_g7874 [Stylonectria norvegica]|nr:hypothetical protein G7046_g7874 [Stylonectria norvegica]